MSADPRGCFCLGISQKLGNFCVNRTLHKAILQLSKEWEGLSKGWEFPFPPSWHPPVPTFPLGFEQIHPKEKEGVGKGGWQEGTTWKRWDIGQISPKIQSGTNLDPVDTTGSGLGGSWDSMHGVLCCARVFPGFSWFIKHWKSCLSPHHSQNFSSLPVNSQALEMKQKKTSIPGKSPWQIPPHSKAPKKIPRIQENTSRLGFVKFHFRVSLGIPSSESAHPAQNPGMEEPGMGAGTFPCSRSLEWLWLLDPFGT